MAAEVKVISLTAIIILFSSTAVVPQERMTAYAQLQLNADTICVLNPEQCDEARQQEFSDTMQRAMEEAQREEYIEENGEEPPTTDELMEGVEDEGDFDDARLGEIFEENGIPFNFETGDPIPLEEEVRAWDQDIEFARQLMNETFTPILTATPTEQETETMQVDMDEDEEDSSGEYTITFYEFNPDTEQDDVRIYAPSNFTVQNVADHLARNINDTDILLYDNGRGHVYCDGNDWLSENDDIFLFFGHPYSTANGYVYDQNNYSIVSPTGQNVTHNDQWRNGLSTNDIYDDSFC